jgi:hypothetical protein
MPIKLTSNEIEAANRAEATEILIRAGFRVYRPEADCYGEDLILRNPNGELLAVQLKSRWTVDQKYFGHSLWMLFPEEPYNPGRRWFLVLHDELYKWVEQNQVMQPSGRETEDGALPSFQTRSVNFLTRSTPFPKAR